MVLIAVQASQYAYLHTTKKTAGILLLQIDLGVRTPDI